MRRTASCTAQLILLNAKLYEEERDREITRYRFSLDTLRRVAGRVALRSKFLADLEDEIAELGWLLIPLGTDFGVMDLSKTENWVKLGGKRLSSKGLRGATEQKIAEAFERKFPPPADLDSED